MDNIEREITQAEEYNQQGRVLYSMDKYEDAVSFYLKAEKEDPMLIQTYFNLTDLFKDRNFNPFTKTTAAVKEFYNDLVAIPSGGVA